RGSARRDPAVPPGSRERRRRACLPLRGQGAGRGACGACAADGAPRGRKDEPEAHGMQGTLSARWQDKEEALELELKAGVRRSAPYTGRQQAKSRNVTFGRLKR
ncbi:unnamed protein product, partial [Prorocentrum cordatum]